MQRLIQHPLAVAAVLGSAPQKVRRIYALEADPLYDRSESTGNTKTYLFRAAPGARAASERRRASAAFGRLPSGT